MENKLEGGGPTKQRSMQVSFGSVNDDHRPSEVNASGSVRPVLNYSIQTGEEFALEFMLERTNHKKASDESAFGDQNINNMVSTDGITENLHSSVEGAPSLQKKGISKIDDGSHCELPRAALGEGSSRETSHGHACMVSPETSSKVKLFCSFGGRILPRPSDGNLRYVGGDTHIIRVCKDISWQEMLQRMSAIYNQTHTIKYQLPGEDLDSLVSISCDEDLQNMMEECNVIVDGDRSQKLRMFLFSSKDADEMQFGLGTREGDSEVQYVAAVNGMDLVSGRSSDGHVLAKTSANDLELFLNHNKESSQVTMNSVEMESAKLNVIPLTGPLASAVKTSHIPPMDTNLHNHFESNLHSHEGHIGDVAEGDSDSHIGNHTSDNFQNIDCKTLIGQHITERLGNGFRECDAKAAAKEVISNNYGSIQQMNDCNPTVSLENESFPTRQQHIGTANFKEESCSSSASEYTTLMSSKRIMNPEQNSSTLEAGNSGHTHELNDDDHSHTSTEVFAHGFSNYEVDVSDCSYSRLPSHSFQVYHSERIPREQAQLINRLSKSDDSIGAQFLTVNSNLSQDSTCESFDPFYHGAKQPTLSTKQTCHGALTVEDGLKQIENYREFADAIMETSHCEAVLNTESKKPEDFAHHHLLRVNECSTCQSMHNSSEAATNQMVCGAHDQAKAQTDDLGHAVGLKSKISDLDDSTLMLAYDKKTIIEEGFLCKAPENRPLQSYLPDVENGNTKGQPKEPLNGDSKLDKWKSSTGAVFKSQVAPASDHSDVTWEEKSKRVHLNNAVRDDNVARPESFTAALPLAESSAFDSEPQKRDILTEINDRFPPGLLSNIFSIVRNTEGVSSPLYNGQTTLSMNVQNPEPRNWSYFRNFAQDQFDHNNVSLMDQDHIGYPSLLTMAEEVKMDMGGESMQVENPFLVVGVNLRRSVSDSEEGKLEYEDASGPFIDISDDFDLSNLQSIKNEDLEELKELGSGTFGTVYHGKWRGTDVAIKRIKKSCLTGHSSEQERLILEFWKEAEILSNLHHPNVLAFYGVVKDGPGNTLATVTEFMVNGSLRHVLLRKDRYLDFRKQLIIAMDTAFGMEYLHSKNIVHFDLKCDNLLVNFSDSSRPICKVCDFGLSKIKRSTLVSGGVRGTLPWMAPELLSSSRVSEKVDVFSFGIVMWEIITGEEPYANMHYGAIIGGIVNNTLRPPVPKSCDPDWKKLMEQCWVADPVQRPSFTEIASQLQLIYATHKGKTPSAK